MRVPLHKRMSRQLRGSWRQQLLGAHGIGIVASTLNGLFVVDASDFNVGRRLLEKGEYDWREVQTLARLLNRNSRMVVIGAHIGALLIPLIRLSGANHVIAVEPSPRNYRLLQMNLHLNGLSGLALHNVALGSTQGVARFTENRINSGNSRIAKDTGEIVVPLVTLDSIVPEDATPLDLVIMDAEGFEVQIMNGGRSVLSHARHLFVEFAPEQLHEQGSTAEEFIGQVADRFDHMQWMDRTEEPPMTKDAFINALRSLPKRRGLLRNLLFSKSTAWKSSEG